MLLRDNKYTNKRIEFHILQSFPVTCLNRDDVGSPKTAYIGGCTRARVSSQCWKRQIRLQMHELGQSIGIRTKHLGQKIMLACKDLEAKEEEAQECSAAIAEMLTKDTLHFISQKEINGLAAYCKEKNFNPKNFKAKEVIKVHKMSFDPNVDGLDIALFGRMVAQAPDINIEAAASFSHAISTHKAHSEIDFFTAIDDYKATENAGSSHLGNLEFNSATYYRYISIDLGLLYNNCNGDENFEKALDCFVKALYVAVPNARQTTQSGACSWDYARVMVRKGQRMQLSFETAVKSKEDGFLSASIEAMDAMLDKREKLSGSLYGKIADYKFGLDEEFNVDDLCKNILNDIKA